MQTRMILFGWICGLSLDGRLGICKLRATVRWLGNLLSSIVKSSSDDSRYAFALLACPAAASNGAERSQGHGKITAELRIVGVFGHQILQQLACLFEPTFVRGLGLPAGKVFDIHAGQNRCIFCYIRIFRRTNRSNVKPREAALDSSVARSTALRSPKSLIADCQAGIEGSYHVADGLMSSPNSRIHALKFSPADARFALTSHRPSVETAHGETCAACDQIWMIF